LLESMRRIDETSEKMREDKERRQRRRFREIRLLLEKVSKAEGIEHVFLHTTAGFLIFYVGVLGEDSDKITELGNEISSLIESFDQSQKFIKASSIEFCEIHSTEDILLFYKIPRQDVFLRIVGSKK
ncbi:MAG: hypothetical protein ACE5GL_08855, partial [Calditrichia bacterium]